MYFDITTTYLAYTIAIALAKLSFYVLEYAFICYCMNMNIIPVYIYVSRVSAVSKVTLATREIEEIVDYQ